MFLIYPAILHILFASMQCFDSLSDKEGETGNFVSRMQLVPDISCEENFYTQVFWTTILPSCFVYCFLIPLFAMRQLVMSSHWFFHSNRPSNNLTDEEFDHVIGAKSSFGFFVRGLSTGRLINREITDKEFPIENNGTFSSKNRRSQFKVCCQEFSESVLTFLYYPITNNAVLVRISPKQVSKSYFYWELVPFLQKIVLLILATRFSDEIMNMQLITTLIILSIFLVMQVKNEPYFTPRLNRLHQMTILAGMWYCLCRIIIVGLNETNFGGQVDHTKKFNIPIPEKFYEFTRTYVKIDGDYI